MAGAPGGWEALAREKLAIRRKRAEKRKKLQVITIKLIFFPLRLLILFAICATHLHKYILNNGKLSWRR
jgi:hypothetical protein